MIEVSGVPIIGWQLSWLARHGINDVVISTGYLKERIREYVKNGDGFGVDVEYCVEEEPLGTGGALKNSFRHFSDEKDFIMLYGDIITDLDPQLLAERLGSETHHGHKTFLGAIAIIPLRSPFGIVEAKREGIAVGFKEKPILNDYWMNAGVYCLSTQVYAQLPDKGSFEAQVLPGLAQKELLLVARYERRRWRSIDSVKDIEECESEFADIVPKIQQ